MIKQGSEDFMASLTFLQGAAYGASTLLDTTNLYEHELIFLSPPQLFGEMNASNVVHKSMLNRFVGRLNELVDWVQRGHTLIVLGLMPAPFRWADSNQVIQQSSLEQLKPFNSLTLTLK
jgi:hypothetical protein